MTGWRWWVTMAAVSAKEPRISVRVDPQLKLRIESAVARTRLPEAELVRSCIEALCDYVERHDPIKTIFAQIPNVDGIILTLRKIIIDKVATLCETRLALTNEHSAAGALPRPTER